MLDNPKLPPRLFYSLTQAAKELDCSEDYLLHLGLTNRLELVIRSQQLVGAFPVQPGQLLGLISEPTKPTATFHGCFLCLHTIDIEEIVNGGLGQNDFFTNAYILDIGTSVSAEDFAELQSIKNAGHHFIMYAALTINDDPETSMEYPLKPVILEFSADTVLIRHDELSRLKQGKPPEPVKDTPPEIARMAHKEPAPKQKNSYLRTIDALCCALTGSDLTETKAAESVLAALAKARITSPIEARALSNYLKEARDLRKSD